MSDSESLDYLHPGFDPMSLTMPRLRSILVAHNVHYPSTAKKAQLVEIFNDNVVPQSKKILAQRARAKRSSKGIVDAEGTQESTPFDEYEDLPPPASTRRSRSPRKASARMKSEEPERQILPPPATSPSKRKSRASSRQLQFSDTDTRPEIDSSKSVRRVQKPMETVPQMKVEDSNEGLFRRTSDVFTTDNPFQSGSPQTLERVFSNRRRTAGHDNVRPTSSSSTRRRTEVAAYSGDDESGLPKRAELPFAKLVRQQTPVLRARTPEPPIEEPVEEFEEEFGEEFIPEEQLELATDQAVNGETGVVTARQTRQPSRANWGTSFSVMLVTLLSVYAGWYRQEKVAVGYCGVGRSVSSIPSEIPVPEWAQSVLPPEVSVPPSVSEALEPKCEPCPSHAYCYDDFSLQCEQDYILKPHPLSFGGIVPLPPTCEPDGEKVRRVQAVADRAVEELRERTAKVECGELLTEEGERAETSAIEEQDLKEIINQKRSKKLNNQEFEELWGAAIGEVKAREEVEVKVEVRDSGSVPNTYLTSTSLARIPIACAVKRSVRLGLARYRLQISALISLVLTVLYGRSRYLSNRAAAAQVPALVDLVLERLAGQKELGNDHVDDPWLFLPNLRDDVLRSVHSLSQREKIWQRVRAVVEQNSNVRTGQREGRSGEVGRAWEWIGPSSIDSGRRRRSGRVSLAKSEDDSSEIEKSYLHQKWEESRPIY